MRFVTSFGLLTPLLAFWTDVLCPSLPHSRRGSSDIYETFLFIWGCWFNVFTLVCVYLQSLLLFTKSHTHTEKQNVSALQGNICPEAETQPGSLGIFTDCSLISNNSHIRICSFEIRKAARNFSVITGWTSPTCQQLVDSSHKICCQYLVGQKYYCPIIWTKPGKRFPSASAAFCANL